MRNVSEQDAQQAVLAAVRKLHSMKDELLSMHGDDLAEIDRLNIKFSRNTAAVSDIYAKISDLRHTEGSDEALSSCSAQLDDLKTEQRKLLHKRAEAFWRDRHTQRLLQIAGGETDLTEYDETRIRRILEFVYVSDNSYRVIFRNGSTVIIPI